MNILGGHDIGDIEKRHSAARRKLTDHALTRSEQRDLVDDVAELLTSHHELRLRITRAQLHLDGRAHQREDTT